MQGALTLKFPRDEMQTELKKKKGRCSMSYMRINVLLMQSKNGAFTEI